MNLPRPMTRPATAPTHDSPARARREWTLLGWCTGVLVLCFAWPLYHLVRFSLGSDLYSHIPLIPFISAYLVWQQRRALLEMPRRSVAAPAQPSRSESAIGMSIEGSWITAVLLAGGIGILAVYAILHFSGQSIAPQDALVLSTTALLLLVAGLCSALLGRRLMRAIAFPLAFLVFMIPLPTAAMPAIESFLQYGSAAVAHALYVLAGTPVLREDLVFRLPGMALQIAPECSGIHSSLALLITSIIAGHFFLRSRVNRIVLAVAIVPLALLRNGFRVFVIGELCVHIDPSMIHSPIHHHGGPLFFALSLIPFGCFLWVLLRLERRRFGAAGRI